MKVQSLVMGIVGLAVIIMVLTAAVISAVENAQTETRTTANNTGARFAAVETSTAVDLEITYNSENEYPVTVGDYNIPLTVSSPLFNIAVADNFIIYKQVSHTYMICIHEGIQNNITAASISNGVLSFTDMNSSEEYTLNIEGNLLYAAAKGTYGEFNGNTSVYLNKGDVVYESHN